MDWFSFWLNTLTLAVQCCLLLYFAARFTGKTLKVWHLILYLFFYYGSDRLAMFFQSGFLGIGTAVVILYGVNRLLLKNSRPIACVTTILACYVSQLSFGVINSFECLFFPTMLGHRLLLYVLIILATFVAFALCICCYWCIIKWFPLQDTHQEPYIWMLLPPVLFFFTVELYILQTAYGTVTVVPDAVETGKQIALLILQLLGLGALFSALYAYKRTCDGFRAQLALVSLQQETNAQKTYVAQAQMRYDQTRAFRHDIKNHLSVLDGLLKNGNFEQAQSYLQKLEAVTGELSFPFHTGNPVVDVLLGDKLELAKANGIKSEVSIALPQPCDVDNLDLCVIFANALDNAIRACSQVHAPQLIRIVGEQQGDFFMLEFENTCPPEALPAMGIGLSNVKAVAEKYGGAITIEKSSTVFRLNVLLNSSIHS